MNSKTKIIDFSDKTKFLSNNNENGASAWLMNLYETVLNKFNDNPEIGCEFIKSLYDLAELSPKEIIESVKRSISLINSRKFIKANKIYNRSGRPNKIKKYIDQITKAINELEIYPNIREYYYLQACDDIRHIELDFKIDVSKKTYSKAQKELANLGLLEKVQKYSKFANEETTKMANAYESLKWEESYNKEKSK